MQRSSLAAVALAGLLISSGCMGLFGGSETPTPTADPSPTARLVTASPLTGSSPANGTATASPTSTPLPSMPPESIDFPFPTGVTADRVVSPENYTREHHGRLANTSFTLRYRVVERRANGSLNGRYTTVAWYDGNETIYIRTTATGRMRLNETTTTESWSNGTTAWRKTTTENETEIESLQPLSGIDPTLSSQVNGYLNQFDPRVTGWSRLGPRPEVRVASRTIEDPLSLSFTLGLGDIERGAFRATLTPIGVTEYRAVVVGERQGRRIGRIEHVTITSIGSTTVERPDWVPRGENGTASTPERGATPTANATVAGS